MKYKTIYADPPWNEIGGGRIVRGANKHYPLMKTRDIAQLPVADIADDNCHLYLWVTNNFLKDGLDVMSRWGFEYKTIITWAKDKFGLGQYFRGQTEQLLFGVKGVLPYKILDGKRQQGTTLVTAPRERHSKKPDIFYNLIEKVSYPDYVELFARQPREGWDCWGNEVENSLQLIQETKSRIFAYYQE